MHFPFAINQSRTWYYAENVLTALLSITTTSGKPGGTASLLLDSQGKALGQVLLSKTISVPATLIL